MIPRSHLPSQVGTDVDDKKTADADMDRACYQALCSSLPRDGGYPVVNMRQCRNRHVGTSPSCSSRLFLCEGAQLLFGNTLAMLRTSRLLRAHICLSQSSPKRNGPFPARDDRRCRQRLNGLAPASGTDQRFSKAFEDDGAICYSEYSMVAGLMSWHMVLFRDVGNVKSRWRRKAKRKPQKTHIHVAVLGGNLSHRPAYCSKERVIPGSVCRNEVVLPFVW